MGNELVVGQKRNFTNSDKIYVIKEIIENPQNLSLEWKWEDGVCPHCREKISRTMVHSFYRIEVLADDSLHDNQVTTQNLVLLGDAIDGRRMMIPYDKYSDILLQTKKYNKFVDAQTKTLVSPDLQVNMLNSVPVDITPQIDSNGMVT